MNSKQRANVTTHAMLVVFSAFALLPFLSIVLVSLYPPNQAADGLGLPHSLDFGNYAQAWTTANFGTLLKSSAVVALGVVPLGTIVCILTGYAFGTMTFRFKTALFYIFLIGLILPFEATVIPLYYDESRFGLVNTYPGLILPEAALFLSFGTLWMRGHFLAASPALIEAARLDGCNSWQLLWRILIPNARAPITTMMVLFFTWSWNEFLLALVLAQAPNVETAPAGLGLFVGQHITNISGLAAAAIIVTIPVLAIYVLLQRQFIRGVTAGSLKG
jgi:raffinose/stachyose/melibiose transport system permease protein